MAEEGDKGSGPASKADVEAVTQALEKMSSVMGSRHDWADDDDDGGLPSAELFADVLPEATSDGDSLAARMSRIPVDARPVAALKSCPQLFGHRHILQLFDGLEVRDIDIVRNTGADGKGKTCYVEFANRRQLAEALGRDPASINQPGVQLLLAADDPEYIKHAEGRGGEGPGAPPGPPGSHSQAPPQPRAPEFG
eukprot:CAMPEP_0177613722 /NCGR_PEP_ID=MMETSP0419_2-20121207/22189_1 /TAXON_ID=582737 /ORGANISM="Tetraselmis sp., Strain GSL018" /LENGTH=194 /DNA_ID=CAMNT_0019110563 /DNA_START=239 /DNA_END=819 /DNA_ORIENTATION=+